MGYYLETSLGYRGEQLREQAGKAPILTSSGNVHLNVSHMDSALSAIYGWQRLGKKKKLLRHLGSKS